MHVIELLQVVLENAYTRLDLLLGNQKKVMHALSV